MISSSLHGPMRGAQLAAVSMKRSNAPMLISKPAPTSLSSRTEDVEEVRRVCAEVNGPIMYNQTGISPRFSEEEMNELGIAMTILPGATMRMQLMAVYDLAIELKEKGPMAEAEFTKKLSNHPLADFHGFAGFDQVMEEERFMGEAELAKYEGTLGHQPKAAE